jgi:hypothetical protein
MAASEPGWHPDPVDGTLSRWWDGQRWTDQVARDGVVWKLPLPPTPVIRKRRRMPVWGWILIGLVILVPAFLLSPFVAAGALAVLITGVVALAKGTPTWLRFRSRKAAAGVTAAAAVAFLIFGGTAAAVQASRSAPPVEAARFADTGPSNTDNDSTTEVGKTPTPTPTPVTTVSEEVVTEAVAFEKSTLEDETMAKGETLVTTAGKAGERTLTYRVTSVDGKETKRELVADVVTVEPVAEVTSVGTHVAPPPPAPAPAQPAGCDSNYADACVPVASDVDCAWGSGDGPAYFDGVARVVGSDVYDRDRDNDGFACEQ